MANSCGREILPSQVGARQEYNAPTPVTTWSAKNSSLRLQISAVRDHDLPKVAAVLEMPISLFRFGERECPVDHGAQVVHRNRTVHGLEIGAAADADRAEGDTAAGQQ